jgi:hypothetical protein
MDQLLKLGDMPSELTRRARRSQIIRKVNEEYDVFYGRKIVEREKNPYDKRKFLYRITLGLAFLLSVLAQSPGCFAQKDGYSISAEDWLEEHWNDELADILLAEDVVRASVGLGGVSVTSIQDDTGFFVMRAGDFRVVMRSPDTLNVSRSHNMGYNFGAYFYQHYNELFALGGYGYWNDHNNLIRFSQGQGVWEQVFTRQPPDLKSNSSSTFSDFQNKNIYTFDLAAEAFETGEQLIWRLSLDTMSWSPYAMINPEVWTLGQVVLSESRQFVLLESEATSFIIRKSDLSVRHTKRHGYGLRDWSRTGEQLRIYSQQTGYDWVRWWRQYEDGTVDEMQLDLDSCWAQWNEPLQPLFLPLDLELIAGFDCDANSSSDAKSKEVAWGGWWFALLLSVLLGYSLEHRRARFFARKKLARSREARAERDGIVLRDLDESAFLTEEMEGDILDWENSRFAELAKNLVDLNVNFIDADGLDEILDIRDTISYDTRRSRRSNIVRVVNKEYKKRFGLPLIRRARHPVDRRRTIYYITVKKKKT